MAKFREILKNKNFFLLWLSQIISQFGDRLNQMALIALIYSRAPGSTWEMAKLLSFTIIPVFIIGPVAGVYVDRWSRQRTMFVCDLARACLVFIIAFYLLNLKPIFPIYIAIFFVFSVGRFFVPAKMSIIPSLVKKSDLLLANSLVHTTGIFDGCFGAIFDINVIFDDFGADETFFEIGVDNPCRLWGFGSPGDRPGADLFFPGGKVGD